MSGSPVVVPEKHLIGLSFSGNFPALVAEMPKLWATFLQRQSEIPLVIQPDIRYDISSENRSYQMHTEYIAVEVERFERIPVGMVGFTIPERRYARFTHTGPMERVQATYRSAFEWLSQQGLQVDETVMRMEQYDQRFVPSVHPPERAENAYDIFIPIL
ncbi:GyrI-like domain-containing protein [Brevibacillus choshinensis]|uniref:AraC family transcriptional regulator n=1 Tax=Brevibacillus choshinensis TaxID=54911 RepID=A0ABX7FT80_BRECH|nr:GyrI-like domain-containing protein [Brevibacillus choshinensis]QRG69377.1 AraC family transcriptional regulator [Brevibacillus choshinensis]